MLINLFAEGGPHAGDITGAQDLLFDVLPVRRIHYQRCWLIEAVRAGHSVEAQDSTVEGVG